jgi:hypothetical protein
VAVPFVRSMNVTPDGSRPVLVILGAGSPVVVTVNLNAWAAVAAELLVKPGPPPVGVPVTGVLAQESLQAV